MKTKLIMFTMLSSLVMANEIPTISVTGTGTISSEPDTMKIVATVETSNPISEEAVTDNTAIIKKTINLLKKTGLKEKDIKTENYTLNFRADYSNDKEKKFFVTNQITITSKDLKNTGDILSALNKGGVSNIGQVQFLISDKKELQDKAYKLAYEDAKEKAALIANMENLQISPKEINLNQSYPRPFVYSAISNKALDSSVPITIPNSIDISANINATFYMEKK